MKEDEKMRKGAYVMSRDIFDSDIWLDKPAWWLKVWVYIIGQVNHKPTKHFERGEGLFTYDEIYRSCRLSKERITKRSLQHVLMWLRNVNSIVTRKTTRGVIIKVLKYDEYQSFTSYEKKKKRDTKSDSPRDTRVTRTGHKRDTINKNEKNEKNGNITTGNELRFLDSPKALLGVDGKEIVAVFSVFAQTNPNINYGHKTNRMAAARLIKKFGLKETVELAQVAVAAQEKKYFPVITTPHQLETKLAELRAAVIREDKESMSITI